MTWSNRDPFRALVKWYLRINAAITSLLRGSGCRILARQLVRLRRGLLARPISTIGTHGRLLIASCSSGCARERPLVRRLWIDLVGGELVDVALVVR